MRMKMLLNKQLRHERMLSPHAGLFYPKADIREIIAEMQVKQAHKTGTIKKEDIVLKLKVPTKDIILKEERVAQT